MSTQQVSWWQSPVRSSLRWLLRMDVPAPERTEADLAAEAETNYRWNFVFNVGDGVFWWFGLSFISATTMLPLFVNKLSTDPLWIALLGVISSAAWYLPQLFAAGPTERLPLWFLPISALVAPYNATLALIIFFAAYAWHGLGAGAIAPAWSDMVARCFPIDKRGWYFGFTAFIGTGLGILGAAFSSWMLVTYPYPDNFVYAFLLAAISITFSWASLAMTREPVKALPPTSEKSNGPSWRKIFTIWRGDHNFRKFLIARFLINVGRMGAAFLTVYAIDRWGVPDATVGWYTAALFLGQTLGTLIAGVLADRRGHIVTLELGQWMAIAAFGMAWVAPTPDWFYAIFFFMGLAAGITTVSGVLSVMEFSLHEHLPTYVGIGNTVSGLGSLVAPIIGGLLAFYSYPAIFGLSTLVSGAALLLLIFAVREPRKVGSYFDLNATAAAALAAAESPLGQQAAE